MLPPPALRGTFRTDARARAAYSEGAGIYRILPYAVARPLDVEDIRGLIGWASQHRVGLVPRGAGSAMAGGNVGDGVVLDLTGMERKLEVKPSGSALTSTGVTLAQLNSVAAQHGLRLPPDPSSGRWATLGGMVSTNAAGARSVRYGTTRRWVHGLTLITAEGSELRLQRGKTRHQTTTGTLARFCRDVEPCLRSAAPVIAGRFPRTRKNASGYALDAYLDSGDILDLVVGAEGTLGIITEIKWRLDPIPPCRAGLRVQLASLDQLSDAVAAVSRCDPSAVELLDRSFLDLVGVESLVGAGLRTPPEAVLLVELERSSSDALAEAISQVVAAAEPHALLVETASSPAEAEQLWAIRHAASPILAGLPEDRRSLQVIEDACVPLDRMGEYIASVRRLSLERRIPAVIFGHAGDGHLHVNLLPELAHAGWEEQVAGLLTDVTALVVRLGGTPSGEHGDGRLRAATLRDVYGDEIVELFGAVKRAFDPAGIFNPGIILPSGQPPISRLKVGANAAPIPGDIQQALRQIELTGGYGRCRMDLADQIGEP